MNAKQAQAFQIRVLGDDMDSQPKFSVKCAHYGQSSFVEERLLEEGVRCIKRGNEVCIYSKQKLPILEQILKECEALLTKEEPPVVTAKAVSLMDDTALIGVYMGDTDTLFLTEKRVPKIVSLIFQRKLRRPKNMKIFSTAKEFKECLELEHRLLI